MLNGYSGNGWILVELNSFKYHKGNYDFNVALLEQFEWGTYLLERKYLVYPQMKW